MVFLVYDTRSDTILFFYDDARSSIVNGPIETLLITTLFIMKFPLNYSYQSSKSDHYWLRYGILNMLLHVVAISPISTLHSSTYRMVLPASSSYSQPLNSLSMMLLLSSTTWFRLELFEDILPSWSAFDASAENG
jgi:hypothetical protein